MNNKKIDSTSLIASKKSLHRGSHYDLPYESRYSVVFWQICN